MSKLRQSLQRLATSIRGNRAESELAREINAHLQHLEDKFIAEGMNEEEARYAARRAFGNVEQVKELQRDTRSFRWLTGWGMELRLGLRMLARYPGLTVVGGLAMALAILVGVGVFEVIQRATSPDLPLPDGQNVVGLTYWDHRENDRKSTGSFDFHIWREGLTKLQDLGAFRLVEQNLATNNGVAEPITVAQISPSAFRITRTPPLLGRTLVEEDERLHSPAVVVLGYNLWQSRFGGDRAIVGSTVRLGAQRVTVAGVMPEGFAFPVDDQIWTPLRSSELARVPGQFPLKIFARLAPGATLQEAQAEVSILAKRMAESYPEHYAPLTPQVLPYANSILWLPPDTFTHAGIQSINLFALLLLLVICGNVGLLMLTRTATREREILVRTALGATRLRILVQLLLEALVLAALALVLGLATTSALLNGVVTMLRTSPDDRWPFWLNAGISPATLLYATLLTLLAAVIVGVLPGVKIMGKGMPNRLNQSSAGAGGLRMGKLWTTLVVTQIAATVLFTAVAFVVHRQANYLASVQTVFPSTQYLSLRLGMESSEDISKVKAADASQSPRPSAGLVDELERRLANEPEVLGVTVAEHLPMMATTSHRAIEVEGITLPDPSKAPKVGASSVAPNLFEVFQMPIVAGRVFDSRDLAENANTIVVNDLFVTQVLGGRNPIGQRIRYAAVLSTAVTKLEPKPGPWLEIVGVVRDLIPDAGAPLNLDNPARPRLYRCLRTEEGGDPLYLAVHTKSPPQSLAQKLRRIAGDINPKLQLHEMQPLDHAANTDTRFWRAFANLFAAGSAIVLFLSLAGIYSVTACTVSRRTREIGVRLALGASASRVLVSIFRRPLFQVGTGIVIGCGLLAIRAIAKSASTQEMLQQAAILIAYGLGVMAVCALACLGPALRALRVNPVEALRNDS